MKIEIRGRTIGWIVCLLIASAALITCGKVKTGEDVDAPVVDDTCTWDTSQWDGCKLAP